MEILRCKEKGDIFWKFAILLVYTIPMFLKKPASQSVSESVSQSVSQSVRRSVSQVQSVSQSVQFSLVSQSVCMSQHLIRRYPLDKNTIHSVNCLVSVPSFLNYCYFYLLLWLFFIFYVTAKIKVTLNSTILTTGWCNNSTVAMT